MEPRLLVATEAALSRPERQLELTASSHWPSPLVGSSFGASFESWLDLTVGSIIKLRVVVDGSYLGVVLGGRTVLQVVGPECSVGDGVGV